MCDLKRPSRNRSSRSISCLLVAAVVAAGGTVIGARDRAFRREASTSAWCDRFALRALHASGPLVAGVVMRGPRECDDQPALSTASGVGCCVGPSGSRRARVEGNPLDLVAAVVDKPSGRFISRVYQRDVCHDFRLPEMFLDCHNVEQSASLRNGLLVAAVGVWDKRREPDPVAPDL